MFRQTLILILLALFVIIFLVLFPAFILPKILWGFVPPSVNQAHATPIGPDGAAKPSGEDLVSIINLAQRYFYQEINPPECMLKIITSDFKLKACLGEHTHYFSPQAYEKMQSEVHNAPFGGVSFDAITRNGMLVVTMVLPDNYSYKAGLRVNDIVIGVREAGKTFLFEGKTPDQIKNALRGKIGSAFILLLERLKKPVELNMIRQVAYEWLAIPRSTLFPEKIGLIRIVKWYDGAADQLKTAVEYLLRIGMKKIVLDVRGNPGGHLGEALSALTLFESDNHWPLVATRGRAIRNRQYTRAVLPDEKVTVYAPRLANMPCAVLTDKGSASASEIFAAYLKHKGCYTIGETTYKKGTVQEVFKLQSGAGVWLTVAEYFVGPNIKIEGSGVSPTITALNPKNCQPRDEANDIQLKIAVEALRTYK